MNRNRPWLRYIVEPDGTPSGEASGGSGPAGGARGGDGTTDKGESRDKDSGDDDGAGKGSKQAVLADLAAERDKRQQLQSELDQLKRQIDDAKLNDTQKLERDRDESQKRVGELETDNTALKLANQRLLIAIEERVPADWVARIQGATPEEMREDAKKIKASLRDDSERDYTPGAGHRGGDIVETAPGLGTLRAAYAQNSRK